jgi:hypothetical protein
MAVERRGPFWDIVEGRVPAPPVVPFQMLRSPA